MASRTAVLLTHSQAHLFFEHACAFAQQGLVVLFSSHPSPPSSSPPTPKDREGPATCAAAVPVLPSCVVLSLEEVVRRLHQLQPYGPSRHRSWEPQGYCGFSTVVTVVQVRSAADRLIFLPRYLVGSVDCEISMSRPDCCAGAGTTRFRRRHESPDSVRSGTPRCVSRFLRLSEQ